MPEDLTYNDIPPHVRAYLSRPGVNKEKALQWFSLGISEPQTYNQAKLLAEAVGNSPEQAKVVAGQWQFESSGGSRVGANHNYFGIQAHSKDVRDRLSSRGINVGVGEDVDTPEIINGKKVSTKNKFMEFDNAFDGFQAHRVFLETNDRYKNALAAETAKDFAKGLEQAGYATATNYGTTLYNDYVAPKEKNPLSGDKRPASLGTTASKAKLGTSEKDQVPVVIPALPTAPVQMIQTETLGVRPEISTSPAQASYIPTNSAPIVMPESQAMQMTAPKGWFGSGKSTFNAMGGTMYKQGGGIHINPAHEGDFTAKANAAGMGVQEYASKVLSAPEGQYDPSTRKQANFARNAAGWNHEMGGNLYAVGGSLNNAGFNALPKEVQNKIRTNMNNKRFAEGGPMGQLTEFNAGGSHEENPLGGIPQGQNPDGGMNLVEENETKFENYVYSDQIKITKDVAKALNLSDKLVGKTYADASKKLNYSSSRREEGYDTIQDNASKKNLEKLKEAQELQKQLEVQKKVEEIQALDPNALAQIAQSYQPQGIPPQGMAQGQPSPEEMAMMEQQGQMMDPAMQGQPPMDPAMMEQMMAQQQGAPQMMQYGGPMSYKCGGNMYDFGGVMRNVGAGAYGIGEGMLDTLSMGLTDKLTDKGYDALSGIGNASAEELEQGKSVRGFGNTAGAIGGAVLNPASMGSAVSEGSEGLAAGVTNLEGTNEKFDKIANTIGQIGSIAGGFVGGNPTEATGAMAGSKGANALMDFANNPLVKQGANMAGMMPQKYGGYQYANGGNLGMPMNYPTYKDNAGPMGQPLTNLYNMGGNMNHYFDGITGPSQMFTSAFPGPYIGETPLVTMGPENDPNYKSLNTPIENLKTEQDNLKTNYENREGLGAFAANMAPIAYNAYQGFLAPQMPLPENMAYQYDPYLQNINSQLRDADKMGAQAFAAARNMGNPGAVSANLGNIASEITGAKSKIREAKENADNLAKTEAAKYNNKGKVDASLARWQLEAQMKNARAEAQKEAFTGIKDYSNMQTQNALASDYNAMAGEGNYTYENIPYLQGLQRTFAASQAARNKKKEDNKTV